jgi:hypothetical protein
VTSNRGIARANERRENAMSGTETLIVAAITAVFALFMVMLAWADHHTRDSRASWK